MVELVNDKEQYIKSKHYNLGCILYFGIKDAVNPDKKMAFEQFSLDPDFPPSRYNRACMMYNGEGTEENKILANREFRVLSNEHGHIPSIFLVAKDQFEHSSDRNPEMFRKCLEMNYKEEECGYYIGLCQIHQNKLDEALKILRDTTEGNIAEVNYLIGELIQSGQANLPPGVDLSDAVYHFEDAEEEHELAYWRLGHRHSITPKEEEKLKQKAEQNIPFYMKIYADYNSFKTNKTEYQLVAAEYYRKLDMKEKMDVCVEYVWTLLTDLCYTADEKETLLKQLISFDHLPSRMEWCRIQMDQKQYNHILEAHLLRCMDQGSLLAPYQLGVLYHALGRETEAVNFLNQFVQSRREEKTSEMIQPALDLIAEIENKPISESTDKVNEAQEETNSQTSYDEFVKVEAENLTEKLHDPDQIAQGIKELLKGKRFPHVMYDHLIPVLKKIGASQEIVDEWTIEGAKRDNKYCLRMLGRKWLEEESKEVD